MKFKREAVVCDVADRGGFCGNLAFVDYVLGN